MQPPLADDDVVNGDGDRCTTASLIESAHRNYYEDLVESAPDGILVVDHHGIIMLVNRQAELLFGYPRAELMGQPVDLLVPDRARAVHPAHRAAYFSDARTRPMGAGLNLTARRKDGTEVPVDISLSPVQTEGGMVVSVAIRDITERKRAESALHDAYARLSTSVAELERHDHDMTLVNEMGDLLQSCLTSDEAHEVISQYGRRLFPRDSGAAFAGVGSKDVLGAVAAWGDLSTTGAVIDREDCWALRRARAYVVAGPSEGPVCRHVDAPPARGYVCVPMMAQGEALGLLHVRLGSDDDHAGPSVLESKRRLALTVSEQISLALANLSLRESLRHQSVSDPLTGLFNRRYMEERLDHEIARGGPAGRPIGIVAVDVDHFKEVNDKHGHTVGDEVLRAVGRSLDASVRGADVVCRYGGDEFIVVLPGSGLDVACQRAEQFRHAVQRRDHTLDELLPPTVTLSLGVAVFPDHGQTAEAVLRSADLALYQAKRNGRDQVAAAADQP